MLTRVTEHDFETPDGTRTAVVVEPVAHVRVGKERLKAFQQRKYSGNAVDREVLVHARSQSSRDHVIVFRGRSATGSWDFAEDLDSTEKAELGYHLVKDQLRTYRRLVAAGVFALLHVEWPASAVSAYVEGTTRLLHELENHSIAEVSLPQDDSATAQIDRWVLKHLTLFYAESFDQVIEQVLSQQLPLLEERIPHLREMVASLPPDSIS